MELKALRYSRQKKVFCIGKNKTGTTSMESLFNEIGLKVGPQRPAELLVKDWINDDYDKILKYVKCRGSAFQDVPFSLPNTFKILDKVFPESKFILTVRDSPDVWYKSLTSFHSKLFGNGKIPNKNDLEIATYVYPSYMWELNQSVYNTPKDDIYNKSILTKQYINYFKDKPGKLLVVNLKEDNAVKRINHFLGSKNVIEEIPWKNKT